jgi:hypothetical protein
VAAPVDGSPKLLNTGFHPIAVAETGSRPVTQRIRSKWWIDMSRNSGCRIV